MERDRWGGKRSRLLIFFLCTAYSFSTHHSVTSPSLSGLDQFPASPLLSPSLPNENIAFIQHVTHARIHISINQEAKPNNPTSDKGDDPPATAPTVPLAIPCPSCS
mmetsp:Transcript_1479/g.3065  ORF Transcript_1479/g.3065 Transcript_1479/m.3065 type:complete len:106 (-) Transcript_1479:1633-1950(-)